MTLHRNASTLPESARAYDVVHPLRQTLDMSTSALYERLLLDLARDVAHGVERPAAPLTTFVVGYAAGCRDEAAERVAQLAASWQERQE